jgi:glutathione peroxidase
VDLYAKYKDQGLEILYFPCNQFGSSKDAEGNRVEGQEPGTAAEARDHYKSEYGATWPVFDHVNVNGPNTHDAYKFLRSAKLKNQSASKNAIEWNFGKFIVGKDGQVLKRYGPAVPPASFDSEDKLGAWLAAEE